MRCVLLQPHGDGKKRLALPFQDMIIAALEAFWRSPATKRNPASNRNVSKFWATEEDEALVEALFKACQSFPEEKRALTKRLLEIDSHAYRRAATR